MSTTSAERRETMLDEVWDGLSRTPKELPPKYFYDERGSALFEEITELPEYYLTRTERALLEAWIPRWVREWRPASLTELGAGSAKKTRILLDAMERAGSGEVFVPVDVSGEFLEGTARSLRRAYPSIRIEPLVADISRPLDLPSGLPRPAFFALLGSTIGNFRPVPATRLIGEVRRAMRTGDAFLLGTDLRPGPGKSVEELEAAYDDSRGVTAEFNRNVLSVLNRSLGCDFDPEAYRHRAFYDEGKGRIEMHLEARSPQRVHFPGRGVVSLEAGETIRTEISTKYDRAAVESLLEPTGLRIAEWRMDAAERFALSLIVPTGQGG